MLNPNTAETQKRQKTKKKKIQNSKLQRNQTNKTISKWPDMTMASETLLSSSSLSIPTRQQKIQNPRKREERTIFTCFILVFLIYTLFSYLRHGRRGCGGDVGGGCGLGG